MSAYQLQVGRVKNGIVKQLGSLHSHSLIPYVSSHRQCSLLPHKFGARTKLLTICMEEKANLVDIGCPRTSAHRVCGCDLTSSKTR
ncbi:hypothetical protein K435DRAFT_786268 [Dendrothele bispora CBS 962.96]|uniref:Uncharacterized protein n=1 Tax=Dendrothele bispora (strain CBS 962.96) TaxID=1314807 RepID=A0A4S8KRK8_DENBC|nr:hypothetical protein K435DRAFT_786268 [Dendrothele bispora CBS 962.96]